MRSFHGFGGRRAGWRLTTLRFHPGFRVGAVFGVVVGFFLSAYLLAGALADDGVSRINREANRVRPHLDAALPDGFYDCEDYAWVKYDELRALGVSPSDMRLFAVTVANGQRHMILVADGWVLDNLEPRIEPEAKARKYYTDWESGSPEAGVIRIR